MKKITILILLLTFSFSSNTFAFTELQTGKITGYSPYHWQGNQVIIFRIENNASSACNTTGRFAISGTHVNYEGFVATILAAYHSKETVTVRYNANCNMFPNSYDLYALCVGTMVC